MEDTNLILIAQTLSTQLGRIADSLERIERKMNTEPYRRPVNPYESTHERELRVLGYVVEDRTYTSEELRRLAE